MHTSFVLVLVSWMPEGSRASEFGIDQCPTWSGKVGLNARHIFLREVWGYETRAVMP